MTFQMARINISFEMDGGSSGWGTEIQALTSLYRILRITMISIGRRLNLMCYQKEEEKDMWH
jgi:hypothetical protein